MKIGDVVIIQDSALRRNQWKLGMITEAFPGCDQKVRRVKLKYINPSTGSFIEVARPVQRLVVISNRTIKFILVTLLIPGGGVLCP